MDAAHVKVIDHENIQDGHHTDWDESALLRILTAETQANSIDTVSLPKNGLRHCLAPVSFHFIICRICLTCCSAQ